MKNRLILILICCSFLFTGVQSIAQEDNYSNLLDKTLSRVGGKKFAGEDTGQTLKVKVRKDTQDSLVLEVKLKGFAGQRYLKTAIIDMLGIKKAGIVHPDNIWIEGDNTPVYLRYALNENHGRGRENVGVSLKVMLSDNTNFEKKKFAKFKLNKKFFNPLLPEEVVVQVSATPYMNAAKLIDPNYGVATPEPPALPSPIKVIPMTRMVTSKAQYNTKFEKANPKAKTAYRAIAIRPDIARAVIKPENQPEKPPERLERVSFLWENLRSDVDFQHSYEITKINLNQLYRKGQTNKFFYVPDAFHLQYDLEEGYSFTVDYREKGEDEILMSGVVTPNIGPREFNFLKKLLKKQFPNLSSISLSPIPHKSLDVEILSELNSLYKIDNVIASEIATVKDPIKVSWVTDDKMANGLRTSIREISIDGHVMMALKGEEFTEDDNIPIPVRIAFEDERTLGMMELTQQTWRTEGWRNLTPFPLKLKYIHALMVDKIEGSNEKSPVIYSWNLNNIVVPSKALAQINAANIPLWIDNSDRVIRMWIDYVIEDCPECRDKVQDQIRLATSSATVQEISFEVFDFFDDLNIKYIDIKVRSLQADSKGEQVVTLPMLHIDQEGEVFVAGELYVGEYDTPDFEFNLKIITQDGDILKTGRWNKGEEALIYITKKLVSNNFPELDNP